MKITNVITSCRLLSMAMLLILAIVKTFEAKKWKALAEQSVATSKNAMAVADRWEATSRRALNTTQAMAATMPTNNHWNHLMKKLEQGGFFNIWLSVERNH